MRYRGKILCKHCRTVLNASAEPVLEREKSWCERQAIFMAIPGRCEHWTGVKHTTNHGIISRDDIEIVWELWPEDQDGRTQVREQQ